MQTHNDDTDDYSPSLHYKSTSTIVLFVTTCFLIIVFPKIYAFLLSTGADTTNGNVNDDPYKIQPCKFPDCVRCRRYAAVNRIAQRKLPYVVRCHQSDKNDNSNNTAEPGSNDDSSSELSSLDRVIRGVRGGRQQQRPVHDRTENQLSPVQGQYPTVLLIPDLLSRPFVTELHHETCDVLQQHIETIRAEYYQNWNSQHCTTTNWVENYNIEGSAPWKVLHLMNQGVTKQDVVQNQFPMTYNIIRNGPVPILRNCVFGNIFFSHVSMNSCIPTHCGPSNVRHRLHVTIQEGCTRTPPILHVRDKHTHWHSNSIFVFDDSIQHSVEYRHRSSGNTNVTSSSKVGGNNNNAHDDENEKHRVVLIIDLWHPDLSLEERNAIRDLYPASSSKQ